MFLSHRAIMMTMHRMVLRQADPSAFKSSPLRPIPDRLFPCPLSTRCLQPRESFKAQGSELASSSSLFQGDAEHALCVTVERPQILVR